MLKASKDDKFEIVTYELKYLTDDKTLWENIVNKGENYAYQHFLLFLRCF